MLHQSHVRCLLLLAQLLVLPVLQATPVSSPEIASKSAKSANSLLVQQQQLKPNVQDAHLNSLNAFASGYDSLSNAQAQLAQTAAEAGFKPSYKLPEMETNFTPMQSGGGGVGVAVSSDNPSIASLPSTPMLMQYLPAQQLQDGSGAVQYLQLIPTRPIIVPISPYLAAAASGGVPQPAVAPALTPNLAATPDFAVRGAPIQLSGLPANSGVTGLHYAGAGLQGYANAIAPVAAYRSGYRINREAKDKNFPPTFSLNLNEYLPGTGAGHNAAAQPHHTQMYIRART